MDTTYWLKQGSEPLFPELEWNKPERRDQAGRLLIIGGNLHNLGAPAQAYELARKIGVGDVRVALPNKTKRLIGKSLPEAVLLPSTSSGEFAQAAAPELLDYAQWADTLLLPGDTGRNSQTTILLEDLLRSYNAQVVLTRDAVDSLQNNPQALFGRPNTTLVLSFAQLQKLAQKYGSGSALTFSMDLVKLVAFLRQFTLDTPLAVVTLHQNQFLAAAGGRVVTTKISAEGEPQPWRLSTATVAACYQTWNPAKPLESIAAATFITARQT